MARTSHDDRFRALVHRRLEPGEKIVATARVWTARPTRFPALASRYRDDAVVTDRRLMVWECGWWTRRARRRVLAERLSDLTITGTTRVAQERLWVRLRVDHPGNRSVVFDIASDGESQRFAAALVTAGSPAPPIAAKPS
jgi:uncharacterized protein (UPF0548 family)